MTKCLWQYDRSKFEMAAEQRVEGARSIVDFHALVNDKLVALVEATSPTVMNKLGKLLTQNAPDQVEGWQYKFGLPDIFKGWYMISPQGIKSQHAIPGCPLSQSTKEGMAIFDQP